MPYNLFLMPLPVQLLGKVMPLRFCACAQQSEYLGYRRRTGSASLARDSVCDYKAIKLCCAGIQERVCFIIVLCMAGKKWCEYCRINLPYDKKAIEDHEGTRRHIQNKQKHIKFERIKIQREQKIKKQAAKANSFTSTANIPKAKKGSQLEKQVQEYRNDIITSGKMAIHQLIAQRTKGLYGAPIEYPEKEDLVLAENYQDPAASEGEAEGGFDGEDKFEMWKIDICEETGKACFINRISQAKVYEPPKGYVMSEEQKEEWEETKKICDEVPEENLEEVGEAGQWEEVVEQDYFQQNKAESEPEPQPVQPLTTTLKEQPYLKLQPTLTQQSKMPTPASWLQTLQQRINENKISESEVIESVLTNTLQECRTVKEKNEALKKLVKSDFQIRATLDRHDQELLREGAEGDAGKKKDIGIKPRKKVKLCQIVQGKDLV